MDVPSDLVSFAAAFDRAAGVRLGSAERFTRAMPQLFPSSLRSCNLGARPDRKLFVLVARFEKAHFGEGERRRLDFWCGRAGVRASALDELGETQRGAFAAAFERCEPRRGDIAPAALLGESARFFTAMGAPVDRWLDERGPVLALEVGGAGWAGVAYEEQERTLFLPGQLAPPVGDVLTLALRFPGADRPLEARARVQQVRSPEEAGPGQGMVGFTLELTHAPPAMTEALAAQTPRREAPRGREQRLFQRYAVRAPVLVAPLGGPGEAAAVTPQVPVALGELASELDGQNPFPRARIDYESEDDLAADFVCENISQGGAFVRTARPSPVGTRLSLSMRLPTGDEIAGPAVVVVVKEGGMGVRFELSGAGQEQLAVALAQLSARPRRVLVVDDDELVRRMLRDAFQERGFEVLTASDGAAGLATVVDELLALDLLVTDLAMPNMDGQTFIRTIRGAGGESDLAIVAMTGGVDSGLEKRLEREGADAVLDKELGAEIIARAADAVLERKRARKR